MKPKTESYTVALNTQTGAEITSEREVVTKTGKRKVIQRLLKTASGNNVWVPVDAKTDKYITYGITEEGDFFVAVADSSRTKGKVMGADCPVGKEDEPLYHKGDKVPNTAGQFRFVGFTDHKEATEVSFEDKMAIAAKYGVKITM